MNFFNVFPFFLKYLANAQYMINSHISKNMFPSSDEKMGMHPLHFV